MTLLAARTKLGDEMSSKAVSAWMATLARRKARKMTKAQRTALALKMNAARWAKAKGEAK